MTKQKRLITGIYGGSFNPIHNGHIQLANLLKNTDSIDEMWLLVSPQNPFKVNADLLDDEARLHLARVAVADVPGVEVCDREFSLPRPSYMYNTLKALSKEHPEREFVLVIGADNWERFPDWYRSKAILSKYRIIIYPRPGYDLQNVPPKVIIADTPLLDISSTDIRHRIANDPNYDGEGLPAAVWEEIKAKGLYVSQKVRTFAGQNERK